MNSKFLKCIFAVVFSISLVSQANATLIVKDDAGIDWAYLGSYNLADGPKWFDADGSCKLPGANRRTCGGDFANPVNGIEAAGLIFALETNEIFAMSTSLALVNHMAFYDEYKGNIAVEMGEAISADADGDGFYNSFGDASAYINDRAGSDVVNYVFKRAVAVDVPEPSALAIFALALCVVTTRRLKR
ncbi:PEP-CTERM sorting domain-containing protein [uncultured Paraglaciecola sp.]|uniref:PEP-CTERM sorting domain-containing protein n=1 Tax=uncultured Paraglaciecola sp. TaxID=1765024 RepID=UPI002613EFDB|nr:PEP-CTERM sorting domain-containing protein [uncultured Paraglaciecola sp.]